MRFQVEVHRLAEYGHTIAGGPDCSLVCGNTVSHEQRPVRAAFKQLAHELKARFVLPMTSEVKCKALWPKSVQTLRPISQVKTVKVIRHRLSS